MFSQKYHLNITEFKSSIKDAFVATFATLGITSVTLYQTLVNMITTRVIDWGYLITIAGVFLVTAFIQMGHKFFRDGDEINRKMRMQMLDIPKTDTVDHISE